ncbi:hypothetical protein LTS18_009968, partial [Coniosporium uncinatum]
LDKANQLDLDPLHHVDFSTLRRLKFMGDTRFLPVTDRDLLAISRTATRLEEFHITALSSITINGVMAVVKAAQQTLRVLEHSPRSEDGFFHPHPGTPAFEDHICDVLAHCPKLEDLSISVPSMCAALFANPNVKWRGDCQVRALHLCENTHKNKKTGRLAPLSAHERLRHLLDTARRLVVTQKTSTIPVDLAIELFFNDFIFEPHVRKVHGVFAYAGLASGGAWPPPQREDSRKGPYGSTGLYGKEEEESVFEQVEEEEFLRGVGAGWVRVE